MPDKQFYGTMVGGVVTVGGLHLVNSFVTAQEWRPTSFLMVVATIIILMGMSRALTQQLGSGLMSQVLPVLAASIAFYLLEVARKAEDKGKGSAANTFFN